MEFCLFCGNPETSSFEIGKGKILYHRCPNCDYVSRDRKFRLSIIDEKKRYELHNNDIEDPGYRRWLEKFLDFALEGPVTQDFRVLDFGSGPVASLGLLFRERGCLAEIEDPFFSPEIPEGKFDLITALEVFEHISRPGEAFKGLIDRLSPGGRLCISTEFLPEDPSAFAGWSYRSDATHIGFFSRKGLIDTGRAYGLVPDGGDDVRYAAFRLAHPDASC